MNNAQRLEILQMVESGDVSVDDAIGLMSAAETTAPVATAQESGSQRWFRVRVTNLETGHRKVSVNVPLKLVKWGMSLGSRFAPELDGLDIDEMMADLDHYAEGRIVEVEDAEGNERVEIFIE